MLTIRPFAQYRLFWLPLLLCATLFQAQGQTAVAPPDRKSIFEALTTQEAVKMTLETDLTTLIEQKNTAQYFPAMIRTEDGAVYRAEVRPRGRFRRKVSVYPPLKIKFKKKDLRAAGFDTLNEIKLVLPCYEGERGENLLIREYLAYRMYETMTTASFRARLVRLTIRDTHVEKSKKPMYAILLEDEEEVVARLNGELNENYGTPADSLHAAQAALTIMFQYMIGNTDWDISMLRNVRLIRSKESGKTILVPYDFDFSGLVSAPYASPNSDTGLKNVRDRFLMNNGIPTEALKKALSSLQSAKPEMLALCKSKYLDYKSTQEMIEYLQSFFEKVGGKNEIPQMMKMDSD